MGPDGTTLVGAQCIFRDHEGYLWFGLANASLVKFDGEKTSRYGLNELATPHFPKASGAVLIFEDRNKQLWIGTRDGALMKYNREWDRFELANDSLTSTRGYLYSVYEDAEGYFWLGSMGKGLSRFHPTTRDFRLFRSDRADSTTLWDDYITGLAADAKGTLWITTTGGLCNFNRGTGKFRRFTVGNRNRGDTYKYRVLRSICIARDGKFYLGTYGGLQIYDPIKNSSRHVLAHAHPDSLSHNSLFKVIEDQRGSIWISTFGGGLNRYHPTENRFEHWRRYAYDDESLPSDNLFTVYLDAAGLLWVGPGEEGVAVHNTRGRRFHTIVHRPDDPTSISAGLVHVMHQENDSIYWLGFYSSGLNRLNLKTGKAIRYRHEPNNPRSLNYDRVVALAPDPKNTTTLWIGTEGGGINSLDTRRGVFASHEPGNPLDKRLNKAIASLTVARDGIVWILQHRDGLALFDPQTKRFTRISTDSIQKKFKVSLSSVTRVFEEGNTMWFSGRSGVSLYDRTRNLFKLVSSDNASLEPFTVSGFAEIYPHPEHGMLLLTERGIQAVRYEGDQLQQKRLVDSPIKALLSVAMDKKNGVWYTTPRELTHINLVTGATRQFTVADGLPKSNFERLFADRQGRVFLMTNAGIAYFHPDELGPDTTHVRVVMNDFLVFNKRVPVDPADTLQDYHLTRHISKTDNIRLRFEQNFFSFDFSANKYFRPEKIEYAYRLVGFDREWIYPGNRSMASYTNLDPGHYTFEVKAANADGFWGRTITKVDVEVLPPFYRTWWFITLVVIAVGSLGYYLHRLRLESTLQTERLRNKIASDLHDEVGSSLTRISMYSDLVRSGQTNGDQHTYLEKINTLSREIVGTMGDIVWSIDNENDTLGSLVTRLQNLGDKLFESAPTQFQFLAGPLPLERSLRTEVRQNLYLIVKEALNNAARHAAATQVRVEITRTSGQLEVVVEDNGKGLRDLVPAGNGLRNMKRRAARIGGQLEITTQGGTRIKISVPFSTPPSSWVTAPTTN
jgi:ligand-binding sensor domain-containing protein